MTDNRPILTQRTRTANDNRRILAAILDGDGATLTVDNDLSVDTVKFERGFMVSRAGTEATYSLAGFCLSDLDTYILSVTSGLGRDAYIGAWIDGGIVYLDVSDYVTDEHTAIALALTRRQRAYFDWARGRATRVSR